MKDNSSSSLFPIRDSEWIGQDTFSDQFLIYLIDNRAPFESCIEIQSSNVFRPPIIRQGNGESTGSSSGRIAVSCFPPSSSMQNGEGGCGSSTAAEAGRLLHHYRSVLSESILPLSDHLQGATDGQYFLEAPDPRRIMDDEYLSTYLEENLSHSNDWYSECRMSRTCEEGVVDCNGKVWGMDNLYVADNSVIPVQIDGDSCSVAYIIGMTIGDHLVQRFSATASHPRCPSSACFTDTPLSSLSPCSLPSLQESWMLLPS